jgi:hypothetical protein
VTFRFHSSLCLLASCASLAQAAPEIWDTFSDTWVATDALGRSLPSQAQVGPPRADKCVGIFYFLWLGRHGDAGPFDISKILTADPQAMQKPDSPLWGPIHAPHHWGESLFGYYVSDDEAVIRKHAQMLADAQVDVVIFDVTNQHTYPESYRALLHAFSEVRKNGGKTPQIAFLCPFGNPRAVVTDLWKNLYQPGLQPDLWFRWQGKPLILADPAYFKEEASDIRDFFTFRKPQPDYFQGPVQPDMWSWLEIAPQHPFPDSTGKAEMISVGVAQNAVDHRLGSMSEKDAKGRSFHDGARDLTPGAVNQGLNFAEQWDRALKVDPPFVFITGWNEWIAGRFPEFNGVREPVMFVDQFDEEHSRDIEPMKGGHGDNYYYQMVSAIRRYKGVRELPPVHSRPIRIDGEFDDWREVTPEFRDDIGDPVHRDHAGWGKAGTYRNDTGRNDIVAAQVSADADTIYFHVRTREPLTPANDPNWMQLFIDADQNPATGWLGYDFVLNRRRPEGNHAFLEKHSGSGTGDQWDTSVPVEFRVSGKDLELAIPRQALGLGAGPVAVDFKWADNLQQTGDWTDFTLNGDSAPNDRFNYRARIAD